MVSGSRLDSLDALIEQGGTRVTRHSSNNYGAHGYKFPAGQTREYAFTWWQRDDDGNRVEAGTYRITPFTPRELPLRLKDQETQFIAPPLEIIIE
ncbi:MAG: hypothetical protein H8F28_06900 [Fibrella sp.]|nr:hypothetical protein [Armatimonadota bacterium]